MLKKILILGLVLFTFHSCGKKKVELPVIPFSGVTDVYNTSQIWVFYKLKDNQPEAEVNLNNVISTTHWIINIDKKLILKDVVPVLETVKNKRQKKSPHSAEGMQNYLSYSDSKSAKMALYPVDSLKVLILSKPEYENLTNLFKSDINIRISDNYFSLNDVKLDYNSFTNELFKQLRSKPIHLFFDLNISYQKYLEKRIILQNFVPDMSLIDHTEYMLSD